MTLTTTRRRDVAQLKTACIVIPSLLAMALFAGCQGSDTPTWIYNIPFVSDGDHRDRWRDGDGT